MKNVIKIFTGKSLKTMIMEGGSAYWKLNKARAAKCKYVLLVRNMHADWSEPGHPHRTAFLLGKVSGVTAAKDRFIIHFSEYALLNIPEAWDGSRNPVGYTDLNHEKIDPEKYEWLPFPMLPKTDKTTLSENAQPLSLNDAKLGLAATFGIRPDQIEINIKA